MKKTWKKTLIKIIIVLPYLLILYILQATLLPRVHILGVKPLILPLAVVGTALYDGRVAGSAMGLICGILCDLSFNQAPIVFTLTLTFTGLFVGWLSDTVLIKGFPSYLIMSFLSLVLFSFVQMFSPLFLLGQPFSALLDTAWRQTVVSLILTIPMYYVTRSLSRVI